MRILSNKFKLIIASLLCVLLAGSIFGLVSTSTQNKAYAEDPVFAMDEGAYIRASEPMGLRFVAKVDKTLGEAVIADANRTFGALIVPNDSLTGITGEWVTNLDSESISYISMEGLALSETVDGEGLYNIAYSITNIKDANVDRDFFAIFYIKDATDAQNPTYQYATFNEGDNVKNIATVAAAALSTGEYEGDIATFLQACVDKGEVKTVATAISALQAKQSFEATDYSAILAVEAKYNRLSDGAKALINVEDIEAIKTAYQAKYDVVVLEDMSDYPGLGYNGDNNDQDRSINSDDVYGNVLYKYKNENNFSFKLTSEANLSGYTVYVPIRFNLTDADETTMRVHLMTEENAYGGGENKYPDLVCDTILEFSGDYITTTSQILVYTGNQAAVGSMEFAPIYAVKVKAWVATFEAIDALDSNLDKTELPMSEYSKVIGLETAYNALSADDQANVTNYEKLTAIKALYEAKYDIVVIKEMSNLEKGAHGEDFSTSSKVSLSYQVDSVYGNVAKFTIAGTGDDGGHMDFKIGHSALDGYTVYIPVKLTGTGSGEVCFDYNADGGGKTQNVTAGDWTVCEFAFGDLINTDKSQVFIRRGEVKGTATFATIYAAKVKTA